MTAASRPWAVLRALLATEAAEWAIQRGWQVLIGSDDDHVHIDAQWDAGHRPCHAHVVMKRRGTIVELAYRVASSGHPAVAHAAAGDERSAGPWLAFYGLLDAVDEAVAP